MHGSKKAFGRKSNIIGKMRWSDTLRQDLHRIAKSRIRKRDNRDPFLVYVRRNTLPQEVGGISRDTHPRATYSCRNVGWIHDANFQASVVAWNGEPWPRKGQRSTYRWFQRSFSVCFPHIDVHTPFYLAMAGFLSITKYFACFSP